MEQMTECLSEKNQPTTISFQQRTFLNALNGFPTDATCNMWTFHLK